MSFTFLYHPKTKQKINLFSKNGKQLLKQYINSYNYLKQHGGMEVEESVVTESIVKILDLKNNTELSIDGNLLHRMTTLDKIKTSISSSKTYCNNQISDDFIKVYMGIHQEPRSNYLMIVYDTHTSGMIGSPRGFVLLTDGGDYLKIDLICVAPKHHMKRDHLLGSSGRFLMGKIETFARNIGKHFIKLDALEVVLTYYPRLGYTIDAPTERTSKIADKKIKILQEAKKGNTVAQTEINNAIEIIAKSIPGFYDPGTTTESLLENGVPMIKELRSL